MKIAIIFSDSPGCKHDAEVLRRALGPLLKVGHDLIIPKPVPWEAINWNLEDTERRIQIDFQPDCVFFIEAIIEHSTLMKAKHRVLIPNPEYMEDVILHRIRICNYIWHKSRLSLARLFPIFLVPKHQFVGFSSLDPGKRATKFSSFLHAKGAPATHRNTDTVLRSWSARPDWPSLCVMSHHGDEHGNFYHSPSEGNIRVLRGWLDREIYIRHVSDNGIHLCTSEVEGFGHYLNESRAMGALIVTTDAPPMNELVDAESGILVKPSSTEVMNLGMRFLIDAKSLTMAVDRILGSDLPSRQRLGAAARYRFEMEKGLFHKRVFECFEELRS
jgi:glycosyltransferase involved in cell wall biosynthesis